MIYTILFFSAFISATLIPFGSEALLIYDIHQGYNVYLLLIVATMGNSLGSILNYFIGLKGEEFLVKKRYLKEKNILKIKKYFDKYGYLTILFSWLPIIGDPITLMAGVLKYDIRKFIILVIIAKFMRYLVIALLL
ncbi:MAG: DedA family protein [Campylobacteraceae bacterium]|jgi:membrane protein YqaA with SNARE-associated domain|nr:DedA family protein [Campylobacteraceae bacterium]MBT3882753.1 DedA family protein [Campylobacteraceae bacterium]MBT4031037.1 DedA family protein [Campylobacteraceae bacterium]MBT4179736.1 DedA family protein [Campylobacteraceae bacterium]MBT4571795.1 DedA family protein [Campylobacteraceae bacterium]